MKTIMLFSLLLCGCGISVRVVDLQWGSTGYAQEMSKRTLNVSTGNQSALDAADSNPLYESQTYKQLYQQKTILPANRE